MKQEAFEGFQERHWQAVSTLWHQQLLCDVQLRASCGQLFTAHSVVLAAASGFFRALLCGAGRSMRECCTAPTGQGQVAHSNHTLTSHSTSSSETGRFVVDLPYSAQQLSELLGLLYDHTLEVCAHNVSWLLDMAAYLEIQPLQDACCEFLRSVLESESCLDVLLLAHRYHCSTLQAEGVDCLAKRMWSLLLKADRRQALLGLPLPLLQQLLSSEALEVDQETELLCFLADWVCHAPSDRQHQLPALLHLIKLSALPNEHLSQQQLQACSGASAAALAQQLYHAAQACNKAQHHPSQQHQQHQPQVLSQQHGSRRQAGPPVADLTLSGQYLSEQGLSGSSSGVAEAGGHTRDRLQWAAPVSPDTNNHQSPAVEQQCHSHVLRCCNNDAMPAHNGSCSTSCGPAVAVDVLGGCDSSSIGAVVAQAWPGQQRGYQPTSILVAGGHDPSWRGLRVVELYDPVEDSWRWGPMLPTALPFAGAGVPTRGQVFVIGGAMCSNYMARLDVANEEWHNCEGPRLSRLHAGVTGSAGLLFVTGGRTQVNVVVPSVEAYDPSRGSWQTLPDMVQPRYAHAVVAQGGCLYALGGQANKAIHRTVEVYEPQRGAWQELAAQLHNERKYCAAASLGGRLLVLGGMNEARRRLSTVEAYDPREGRWSELTDMQHARSSCSVACLGGRLYVMGGNAGNEQLTGSVEVFDVLTGQWSSCAPLSCGRTGLTAVSV